MPKCRDNRRKKIIRRRRERRKTFHDYHKYCSWLPPYTQGADSPKNISDTAMNHGVKQRRIGNWEPLTK